MIIEAAVPHSCTPGYTVEHYDAPMFPVAFGGDPDGPTMRCVRHNYEHHAIGSVYECDECGRLWRCVANERASRTYVEFRDVWVPMGWLASRRHRKRVAHRRGNEPEAHE